MLDSQSLAREFATRFGAEAKVFRAPGRVNLIGEHTDYNDGFVMPAALELEARCAISQRKDCILKVHSLALNETITVDLDRETLEPQGNWSDYVVGVARTMKDCGYEIRGANLLIDSSVPVGSGLSSSAALEVVAGYSLLVVSGLDIARVTLAQICQRAENEFVGEQCGIMDQYISCCGVKNQALMIDCRDLTRRSIPLPTESRILIANSMVHHSHASGEYNARRRDCLDAVERLSGVVAGLSSLRDLSFDALEANRELLPERIYRRSRHVVTENDRVLQATKALEKSDARGFGELMNQSHVSMRDDYEISGKEIDLLVAIAQQQPGVFGSRMTGGGFGGCTVSLVAQDHVEGFIASVKSDYEAATGLTPVIFSCSATDGVGPL